MLYRVCELYLAFMILLFMY